ncbi:Outer membrane protein OmpA [Actinomadura meyerae]|uniref:Outer membrane protein OmpA n=1 Tax=Actinomadura meyerae TaxID=240840 RepID=A0A239MNQ5_9ACTN|nr:Outer membrane protein OmpA [Actinomadura meyerae]
MNRGTGAGRRITGLAAGLTAGALILTGCSDGGEASSGKSPSASASVAATAPPGELKAIASVPMEHEDGPAHVELLVLSRTAANTVTARFRIVNDGKNPIKLSTSLSEMGHSLDPNLGDALAASGIGLVDARNDKVYFPLPTPDEDNKCACTWLHNNPVPAGGYINVYATFPSPPADVQRATVMVPLAVPFQDVPITDAPVEPLKTQVDPTKVKLGKPRILALRNLTEGTDQSVADDAQDRSVLLSTDTLFAVDKADLTPRADQLLRQVAAQIDASDDDTVTVDGHADSTGNDAINQPLSERRAKAVADRLKSLVTRQGVTYRSAGHGSKEPVATNDTEEGRRKNRRVTVAFTRPRPSAPPAAGGGRAYQRGQSATLGTGTFQSASAAGLKVEVNGLHRDSSGLVVMVWTLRNTGQQKQDFGQKLERTAANHGSNPRPMRLGTTGGALLFDKAAQVRYNPLSVETGPCVCSVVGFSEARHILGPGESVVLWDAYKPAPNAANLELQVPWERGADGVVPGLTIG